MPYWEFLIQRENDRAWRPLTSRNLQVSEGNYRIIANTSIANSAVRTQVFYQTDQQPPQLSQNRSQTISNEGMLVILPFTYLRSGLWHLNCNVTVSLDQELHEQLRLKVLPRHVATASDLERSKVGADSQPEPNNVPPDVQSDELISASVSDLNVLLADLDLPPQPRSVEESLPANSFTITSEPAPISAPPLPDLPAADLADPFAAALQIAMMQREIQSSVNPAVTAAQLQQIIADSDLEIAKLDTSNLPLHSYDPHSYEVVVED